MKRKRADELLAFSAGTNGANSHASAIATALGALGALVSVDFVVIGAFKDGFVRAFASATAAADAIVRNDGLGHDETPGKRPPRAAGT